MEIMCMEASREAAEEINAWRKGRARIVLCASLEDVLVKSREVGGDPYKLDLVLKTEHVPADLYVIGEIADTQIICGWRLPILL